MMIGAAEERKRKMQVPIGFALSLLGVAQFIYTGRNLDKVATLLGFTGKGAAEQTMGVTFVVLLACGLLGVVIASTYRGKD
jgi:hypothetical protein